MQRSVGPVVTGPSNVPVRTADVGYRWVMPYNAIHTPPAWGVWAGRHPVEEDRMSQGASDANRALPRVLLGGVLHAQEGEGA